MNCLNISQGRQNFNNIGGLSLIGSQLSSYIFPDYCLFCHGNKVSIRDTLVSYLGLLSLGVSKYEGIEEYRTHTFFKDILSLQKVPSSSTLRQHLDDYGERYSFFSLLHDLQTNLLSPVDFSPVYGETSSYIPLDIDVTPFDNSGSKKEKVSYTYKKYDGYAPIIAYLGQEGYAIHSEFREGKQHCQRDFPTFLYDSLQYSIAVLPPESNILLRVDGGHDAGINHRIIADLDNCYSIVKRNPRKEDAMMWLKKAQSLGCLVSNNELEEHYQGTLTNVTASFDYEGTTEEVTGDVVFDIRCRYTSEEGQTLFIPEIKIDTYWTNLPESPDMIISLYHDHATSEQFHSEIKSDLNFERLPSGKFKTNELIFQLELIAYNMLRRIGVDVVQYGYFCIFALKLSHKSYNLL